MLRAGASRAEYDPAEPLLVAGKVSNSLLVTAVDGTAERIGLSPGMTLATARAIHPALQVIDADVAADRALIESLADWCDRFTPLVALDMPHGLLLDITGCAHLFGDEAAMMQTMIRVLTRQGFSVCAAIAGTAVAARALSRCGQGRIVPPGEEAAAVADLPVAALGADDAIVRGLRRAGLTTIGDVRARNATEIAARFGGYFVNVLRQAAGEDDAPISPRKPVPDYVVEKRFPEPVATTGVVRPALSALAQLLMAAMERSGKGARQLTASFFRTDGVVRIITVDAGHAVTCVAMADRLFAEKFDALSDPLDPGFGFDLIRLAASQTAKVEPAQRGFDPLAHQAEDVAQLADHLSARLGARRVVRYLPQNTHIPERAALALPVQHFPPGTAQEDWLPRVAGEPPLRPLRLFAQPEAIEVLFAEVPDKPPRHFKWRRVMHTIVRAEGPERIAMEWWREGAMLTRDYFRVEDDSGLRFWLYRGGLYGEIMDGQVVTPNWYLHGLFA